MLKDQDEKPLFYLCESLYGCSQPVRRGDLIRVKCECTDILYRGKVCLVVSSSERIIYDELREIDWITEECEVLIDGSLARMHIEDLELI